MSPRPGSPPPWQPRQPWQQRPDLRIGDAERERAASQLAEHYAVGRLSQEEHAERLDRIWAARTQAEIDPVFVDLPGHAAAAPPPWQQAAPRPGNGRRPGQGPGRGIPGPLLVLLVVLGLIAVVTNFPLILIGLGVWFFFLRGGCGPRSSWGHRRRW
jgi:uncharacterized membrane protein